jgi:hypothetical protein
VQPLLLQSHLDFDQNRGTSHKTGLPFSGNLKTLMVWLNVFLKHIVTRQALDLRAETRHN